MRHSILGLKDHYPTDCVERFSARVQRFLLQKILKNQESYDRSVLQISAGVILEVLRLSR